MKRILPFIAGLVAATPAHADPISAAILGTIGVTAATTGGAFAISALTFAISAAASIGLSLLSRALFTTKPKAGEVLSGLETSVQMGGDISRQIAIGRVGAKGQLVYHNTYGVNNTGYERVFVLSDWVSEGLNAVIINGKAEAITQTSSDGIRTTYNVVAYPGLMTLTFYNGMQSAADATLIVNANPAAKWTTNDKLVGLTYVIVSFIYQKDSKLYENGIPDLTFDLSGARLYDWRKDSTNGGVGSHRWEDLSTYEYSENSFVAIYNFQRGFRLNGQLIIGMGLQDYDLLLDTYTAAANACDENVLLSDGGSQKRYRVATMLTAEENVTWGQTLDVLLSTCAGYLYDYSGAYYAQAGVAQSSVKTLTDDDLVIGSPITFIKKRTRDALVNSVHGQFLDVFAPFAEKSYEAQISSVGIIEDTEERGVQLDLVSVPAQFQAERIAQIRLRENRKQASASITVGYEHLALQAGDWITWNSALHGNAVYRIARRQRNSENKSITLELAEIATSVFSWGTSDEGGLPANPIRLIPGGRMSTVSAFGIAASTRPSNDGSTILPTIRAFWTPVTDPTVRSVIIEYRRAGTTLATRITDPTPGDGELIIDGVTPAATYEARATIETDPPRTTTWTAWVQMVTDEGQLAAILADTSITLEKLDQYLQDTFNEVPPLVQFVDTSVPPNVDLQPTDIFSTLEVLSDGTNQTRLVVDFSDVAWAEGLIGTYSIEIKEGSGNFVAHGVPGSRGEFRGIPPGTVVQVRVKAVSASGTPSAGYSTIRTHTVAVNTTPPPTPNILNIAATFRGFNFNFGSVNIATTPDFAGYELWESPVNNRASANFTVQDLPNVYTRTGLNSGDTRFYWVRARNTSGVYSPFFPLSATAGIQASTAVIGDIGDFNTAVFTPVEVKSALPTTGNFVGRQVALTTDGYKLYRFDGTGPFPAGTGGWSKSVAAGDLIGEITATQIADDSISTPKLQANAVTATKVQVGGMSANLVKNGDFEEGAAGVNNVADGWVALSSATHPGQATPLFRVDTSAAAVTGGRLLTLDRGTAITGTAFVSVTMAGQHRMLVERGRKYEFSGFGLSDAVSAAGFYLRVNFYNSTGGLVGSNDVAANAPLTNLSWTKFTGIYTAPDTARYAGIDIYYFTGATSRIAWADQISLRRSIDTTIIEDGAVKTNTIDVNAVNAGKIQAGAVLVDKIGVGISSNKAYNSDGRISEDGFVGWANGGMTRAPTVMADGGTVWNLPGMRSAQVYWVVPAGYAVNGGLGFIVHQQPREGGFSNDFPVVPGQRYEWSAYVSSHNTFCFAQINWYDAADVFLGGTTSHAAGIGFVAGHASDRFIASTANLFSDWDALGRAWVIANAPSGAVKARLFFGALNALLGPGDRYMFVSAPYWGPASPNQVQPSIWSNGSTTVIDGKGVRSQSIVTNHMVANTINGDRIAVQTLDANRVTANTVLSNTVLVGANWGNHTLNDIADRATRPVDYINSSASRPRDTVLIGPGLIQIAGGTTLSNWRDGGDITKIAGGSVAANSITANKLKIGARAISTVDLDFSTNKDTNTISWSPGYVLYEDDGGNVVAAYIKPPIPGVDPPNSFTGTGYNYIYWPKGATYFLPTTNYIIASSGENVLMATYVGGAEFYPAYGGTIIDGTRIVTGSVTAQQIKAYEITADRLKVSAGYQNLVPNSDFRLNLGNMVLAGNNTGLTPGLGFNLPSPAMPGSAAGYLEWGATTPGSGGYADIYVWDLGVTGNINADGSAAFLPINAFYTYELSVSVSTARQSAQAFVSFYDAAGNYSGVTLSTPQSGFNTGADGLDLLKPPHRLRVTGQAPAGTSKALIILRSLFNGTGTQPYAFWSGLQFGVTTDASVPQQWAPRTSTIIHGGQVITGTVDAVKIKANSITAQQIFAGEVLTLSAQIRDAIIINAKIGNLEVQTLKIANNAITNQFAITYNSLAPGGIVDLPLSLRPPVGGGSQGVKCLITLSVNNITSYISSAGAINRAIRSHIIYRSRDGAGILAAYVLDKLDQVSAGPTYHAHAGEVSMTSVTTLIDYQDSFIRYINPCPFGSVDVTMTVTEIAK